MGNVLSIEKQQQVIALGRLKWSLRRIEAETGVRRETAGEYLRAAGVPVREPRHRALPKPASAGEVITGSETAPTNPASQTITGSVSASRRVSRCAAHHEFIEMSLRQGRNAMAIWQDLKLDHGFTARYSSVQRYVLSINRQSGHDARVRIETPYGQEAQVDYGEGPLVRHPESGKYQRTRLFVFMLGASRKAVRLLTFKSSSQTWCEMHAKAFERLGGATRIVVLDNLKEGVIAPDIYDPAINPLYRDMLAHYGVTAMPCRVRDPDRKGKVERGVDHAQRTPLKGLRFETLDAAQAYLDRWETTCADTRIHGTTKRQVAEMFAEERPHLKSLPLEPFRYYKHGNRTVHLDGCVEVQAAYYSAPPGLIGQIVAVQWDDVRVRILEMRTGKLLREHARLAPGRRHIAHLDVPARTPASTIQLLARADKVGANVGALCRTLHATEGETGVRRILGVLAMVKRYGEQATETACTTALEVGAPTYRFVRHYLERHASPPLTLKQIDPLIRELSHYRDLINAITATP